MVEPAAPGTGGGEAVADAPPKRRSPLLSVRGLGDAVVLVLLTGTGIGLPAGLLGGSFWALELFVHFRLQYLGAALVSGWLAAALGRWRVVVAADLLAVGLAASVAPAWFGAPPPPPAEAPRLELLFSNVNTENREYGRLLALVAREQPELVALAEVDDGWSKALEAGLPGYPHRIVVPRQDNFGIALFSKLPLEPEPLIDLGAQGVPTIEAKLELAGERVTLFVTHLLPPISEEDHEARGDALIDLGEVAAAAGPLVLVAGDLNCTSWAPEFDGLLAHGLIDSRAGRGVQPSWPTGMPVLRLPLDHVLHGRRLVTVRRELGESIGSDHFPVLVELALLPP